MKKMLNMKSFKKMILLILLICVCFYLLGLFSNQYSKKVVTEKIMEQMDVKAEVWKDDLEQQIDSLLLAQSNLSQDTKLSEINLTWEYMTPYEQYRSTVELSERLREIKVLHSLVESIKVYFENTKISISSGYPMKDYFEKIDFFEYNQIKIDRDRGIYITTYFPVGMPKGKENHTAYCVRSYLPFADICNFLNPDLYRTKDGLVLLYDTKGNLLSPNISGGKGFKPDKEMLTLVSEKIKVSENDEQFRLKEKDYGSCIYMDDIGIWMVYLYPRDNVTQPLGFFNFLNLGLTVLAVILFVLYASYTNHIIAKPLGKIIRAMEQQKDSYMIVDKQKDEFGKIYDRYNHMIDDMKKLMSDKIEAQYQSKMAEFRQLQYQIQPHFLYNSIFMIYRMAKYDENEEIAEYTKHLGQYYQYITKNTDSFVKMEQEMGHLKNYLYIQETRFGNRIRIEVDEINDYVKNLYIAPMLIQPIVENAYEHGLKDIAADGWIHIQVMLEGEDFIFRVEDNGIGIPDRELKRIQAQIYSTDIGLIEVHGLTNIQARVSSIYGKDSGIEIDNRPKGGVQITLRLAGVNLKNV